MHRLIWLILSLPLISVHAEEQPREQEITAADRSHWSFQPPRKAKLPASSETNPVDVFISQKLQQAGLTRSPRADKFTQIRRVTFDLTGLPPTPDEVRAFLEDTSPQAYEKVVDRLLASPHFGERWAQHWLDVVRFAESNGYELDAERPHAWRYRDYVAKSFNADKPYSLFLREQIAGDELAAGRPPREAADLLIATGMHRCGPAHMVSGNLDREMIRQEYLTEMVNGLGSAVLGLTLQCARCHNHKTDPISTADYYRLQAFFAAAQYKEVDLATAEEKAAVKKALAEIAAKVAPLKAKIAAIDAPIREQVRQAKIAAVPEQYQAALKIDAAKRTPEQKKLVQEIQPALKIAWDDILNAMPAAEKVKRDALRAQMFAIESQAPPPPAAAWSIADDSKRPDTFVLRRGDVSRKGPKVPSAFPRVLIQQSSAPTTRTQLADWLTQPDHPLTARVIVNRLWHHYFGQGIVRTVNDFGLTGDRPSHPELLDYLAIDLVEQGWKLKRLHKQIVMSETYRQASTTPTPASDPENRLLSRQNRKRLDAEAIRDAILAAAGTLNRRVGGPSVRVPLEPEVYELIFTEGEPDGLWMVTPDEREHTRRSLYLFAKRNVRLPILEAFDQPDTLTPCTGRNVSTFAPQALILMNGPFTSQQSRELANRLVTDQPGSPKVWLTKLYQRTIGREPTHDEQAVMMQFLAEQTQEIRTRLLARHRVNLPDPIPEGVDPATFVALADICLAVLNSNEFLYVK